MPRRSSTIPSGCVSRWPAIGPAAWCRSGGATPSIASPSAIRDTIRTHGADAVGVLGSGALTNEKAYLLGKFARVAVGTANIDYNGRYCMSSGAAASNKAFGLDRGLPFPLEDLEGADVVLLAGSNPAETMPPFVRYLEAQKARRRRARRDRSAPVGHRAAGDAAPAADAGHRHRARQRPAPRAAARRPGRTQAYIERRTEGFAKVRAVAAGYWPELVERVTGVPKKKIVEARRALLGTSRPRLRADRARPRAAVAGRRQRARLHQHRARAAASPAPRAAASASSPARATARAAASTARRPTSSPAIARSAIPPPAAPSPASGASRPTRSPDRASSAYELLQSCGTEGGVRALFVMGFNALVSSPAARRGGSAARVARLPRRLRLLPVRDGAAWRTSSCRPRSGRRKTAR